LTFDKKSYDYNKYILIKDFSEKIRDADLFVLTRLFATLTLTCLFTIHIPSLCPMSRASVLCYLSHIHIVTSMCIRLLCASIVRLRLGDSPLLFAVHLLTPFFFSYFPFADFLKTPFLFHGPSKYRTCTVVSLSCSVGC
jgi:hypothetical protein